MKKSLKILLLTAVCSLVAAVWAFGASAATIDDVTLNTAHTGRATLGASDHALNYQWFTLTNNSAEEITLSLAQSPTGEIFEVVADQEGGLVSLGQSNDASITLSAGQTRTVAVTAPGLRSTSLFVWQKGTDSSNSKSLAGIGSYLVYYEYRDAGDTNPATNLISSGQEAIMPGRTLSKTPPESFNYKGERYVPVDASARAISYNTAQTVADRTIVFQYTPFVEGPYDIYVNCINSANGALIGTPTTITVPGVTKNPDGSKNYPTVQVVPQQVLTVKDASGKVTVYRLDPAYSQGTRIHNYQDGAKTYTYRYVEDSDIPAKAYLISIRYVDKATGLILATRNETVLVDPDKVTTTTVALPAEITASNARRYLKCAGEPDEINHLSNNTAQTVYTVYYELDTSVPTTDYEITIIYRDAATSAEIKRETVNVPYLQTINFVAQAQFDATNPLTGQTSTYTLAVGEDRNITHAFADMRRVYELNYNADGDNMLPSSVRIHYVENVANGELYSVTVTVPVNDVLVHVAPEKYDANGNTYVLSSGQSRMVTYTYGDVRSDYYIFYRLEGDVDPNAPNTNPGTTIVGDREDVEDQIGGDIQDAQDENVVVNPDPDADITDEYPDDLFEIPDDETALAEGVEGKGFPWVWTIYGSVVVIAAVLVLIVLDRNRARKRGR